MKYQTEYQRNYQRRVPKRFHELPVEERKLAQVSERRALSSPSRRRGRSAPNRDDDGDGNFVIVGPNEKFSRSHLHRLKQPVKDHSRVVKPQEYAILGRNEKFQDNVVYPLRKPVVTEAPRVVVRRRKNRSHSCGIQAQLEKPNNGSRNARHGNEYVPRRQRIGPQTEYQVKYDWKQPPALPAAEPPPREDSRMRDRHPAPPAPEKISVAVNTPARVDIEVDGARQQVQRMASASTKPFRPKREEISEYQARYRPIVPSRKPPMPKAFEAEHIDNRKREEPIRAERAHSDDEGTGRRADLREEFHLKNPHGKLRRWKSEYQSTYKPFWRFDYKGNKWYKDPTADENGFNPNLFWYKSLMSTRKNADEYRAKAETDHFNRDHTMQLKTGYGGTDQYRAWDVDAEDDEEDDSVISIDRNLDKERLEGEQRREKDARRKEKEHVQPSIRYETPKRVDKASTANVDTAPLDNHPSGRTIYIDEPPPRQPSAATRAFVRNLSSTSVQHHMSWDSESLHSQRTNSDLDFQSLTARHLGRKHYTDENGTNHSHVVRKSSAKKQESRGTGTHSPPSSDRHRIKYGHLPPQTNPPRAQLNGSSTNLPPRPATSYQESRPALGRPTYGTQPFESYPSEEAHASTHDYSSYPGGRFKDEVTEYYYGGDDPHRQQKPYAPRASFQNQTYAAAERYGPSVRHQKQDDDVLSIDSARSLSSSCSLAMQTLERAEQNKHKYWSDHSPKKSFAATH